MPASDPKAALALLRAYQARPERDSLEQLFLACYPLVMRVVELRLRRRLRGDREAEDFVQESLLDMLRGLRYFGPRSEGEFRNWLATIIENNLYDHERRRRAAKRRAPVVRFSELRGTRVIDSLVDGKPWPGEGLGASELEERIEKAMNALDEPYREALILRRLCGLSHAEIAVKLGYSSTSSARSLFTRAMEKLRAQLRRSSEPTPSARRDHARKKA